MADNLASTLCYAVGFITGILFLVLAPYNQNRTVRFHAFQSIFLSVGLLAVRIVFGTVLGVFLFHGGMFGTFWILYSMLWSLFGLACLAIWIYILIATYQGKTIVLPIIGTLAQPQA